MVRKDLSSGIVLDERGDFPAPHCCDFTANYSPFLPTLRSCEECLNPPGMPFISGGCAGMAELVDAPDSKSGFLTEVGVRFPLPAPKFLFSHTFQRVMVGV